MSTPAQRAEWERRGQGLPRVVEDPALLAKVVRVGKMAKHAERVAKREAERPKPATFESEPDPVPDPPWKHWRGHDDFPPQPAASVPNLITEEDVAKMLNVSLRSVRKWRYDKVGPPAMRIGERHIRYRLDEVLAWLDDQRI